MSPSTAKRLQDALAHAGQIGPRNFHEAAVRDFRQEAFRRLRREAQGFWYDRNGFRWYEPPNKRLQRPGAIVDEVDRMTREFIRKGYMYPHYNLPEDVRYFNFYHADKKMFDDYPAKRRAYDY